MSGTSHEGYEFLLGIDRPRLVPVLEEALRRGGIPFETGLMPAPSPKIIISVPSSRLEDARRVVAPHIGRTPGNLEAGTEMTDPEADSAEGSGLAGSDVEALPRGPLLATAGLTATHLALLLLARWAFPLDTDLIRTGGIIGGQTLAQPWRVLTSLFLHADARHVFWNALSMTVFAVPLMGRLGYLRTAVIYLISGTCGGLAALVTSAPGTITVGSSGAVAGLFGAWLSLTLRGARRSPLTGRASLRAIGIAILVLPSLLTPTTPGGHVVSVASHLGGLAAGAWLGLIVSVDGAGWEARSDRVGGTKPISVLQPPPDPPAEPPTR